MGIFNLFLATKGSTKPATAARISSWVKSLLGDSGTQASVGSCRAVVKTLNWVGNYQINDISAKDNWQHEHTVRKFYQKLIINASNTASNL